MASDMIDEHHEDGVTGTPQDTDALGMAPVHRGIGVPELTPKLIDELAVEYGFTAQDVTNRAAQLSAQERAWLAASDAGIDLSRQWLPRPDEAQANRLAWLTDGQAALYRQAATASVVLEQAEWTYHWALANLRLYELRRQAHAASRTQEARQLAWRLIERDLATRFSSVVDPGDPFQERYSGLYVSVVWIAFRQARHADSQTLRDGSRVLEQLLLQTTRRRLRRLARARQAERDRWAAEQQAADEPQA